MDPAARETDDNQEGETYKKYRYVFKTISRYGVSKLQYGLCNFGYYAFVYLLIVFLFHDTLEQRADDCCRQEFNTTVDSWKEVKEPHAILYTFMGILILAFCAPGPIDFEALDRCQRFFASLFIHLTAICVSYNVFTLISNNEKSSNFFGWWMIPILIGIGFVVSFMQLRIKHVCSCYNELKTTTPDLFPEDLICNLFETGALLTLIGFLDTITCWSGSCDASFNGDRLHHYQYGLLIAKLSNYWAVGIHAKNDSEPSRSIFKYLFRICACGMAIFHALGVVLFFHGLVNYGPDRWLGNNIGYKDILLWFVLVVLSPMIIYYLVIGWEEFRKWILRSFKNDVDPASHEGPIEPEQNVKHVKYYKLRQKVIV